MKCESEVEKTTLVQKPSSIDTDGPVSEFSRTQISRTSNIIASKTPNFEKTQLHTCQTYFSFEPTKTSINSRISSNNELKNFGLQ